MSAIADFSSIARTLIGLRASKIGELGKGAGCTLRV